MTAAPHSADLLPREDADLVQNRAAHHIPTPGMDEIWRRVAWAERHGRRVEVEQIIAHMQAEIRRPSILDLVAA